MPKFRKKPVVIEAFHFLVDGSPAPEWFLDGQRSGAVKVRPGHIVIYTLEGEMRADVGDWIIQGVKGELYPCKDDIFAATYDAVEYVAPDEDCA